MISRKDVQHIARLARIELTPDEEGKFEKELSAILGFVAKLEEAATGEVGPLAGGTRLENVMRPDEIRRPAYQDERGARLLEVAPRKRDGYIEVPAVFERE